MSSPPTVGTEAPDFSLQTSGGGKAELSALRGRKVVLYFYPKDDTSGCTREALDFNRLKADFAAAGAEIIGISPDSVASHDKFRAKHGLDFDLAADPETSVLQAYGVWGEKSMYGRKYMGVKRTTFLIDAAGRIAQIWQDVKVPGHAEEVLKAAQGLG